MSGGAGGSPSKDKGTLKKWLDRLADAPKSLAGKPAEKLPAIIGSVVAAALSYLGKAVGIGFQHIWVVIVFIAGLIAVWLMQRVQRRQGRISLVFICDGGKTYLPYLMP